MNNTKIEWAETTWNPVTGCTPISEACQNCYAKRMANRLRGRFGYPTDEPFRVTLHPERLGEPLKWGKPHRVFVCSMSDLFHEDVQFEYIAAIFGVMANTSNNTYILLTKRPRRMKEFFEWLSENAANYYARNCRTVPYDDDRINVFLMNVAYYKYGIQLDFMRKWPLSNVWIGVTAENQHRAEERVPDLLEIPAAVRFVSVEPMLGPVDLEQLIIPSTGTGTSQPAAPPTQRNINALTGDDYNIDWHGRGAGHVGPKLDWVICGGETGSGARPINPEWVRALRDRCQKSGVPFFFKRWGDVTKVGKKNAGRLLDGRIWDEIPVDSERRPQR